MNFSLSEIIKITKSEVLHQVEEAEIKYLYLDTRLVTRITFSMFIAIRGSANNGNKYIKDAFEKGIRTFLTDSKDDFLKLSEEIISQSNFLLAENSLFAFQEIAKTHRNKFDLLTVGITGSNGKTIVKEWIFQLLSSETNIVRSPKSYNSQIGVSLSVLGIQENHQMGLFEAGISQVGEMERLESVIQPQIGIFTNIGAAHQEGFESNKTKIREKLMLFKNVDSLIYCSDHAEINLQIKELVDSGFFKSGLRIIEWSFVKVAELQIFSIEKKVDVTLIKAKYQNSEFAFSIPFTDDASIENACHCLVFALFSGYSLEFIIEGMRHLQTVEMRLELKAGINNCTLINDTYNSDINSLAIALDYLAQQNQHKRKTIILSDIFQSGIPEEELYRQVAELLHLKKVDFVIGIGEMISKYHIYFDEPSLFFTSTEAFLQNFSLNQFSNDAILIKGSRSFSFEKITASLQKMVHSAILEINLQSIVHNLNVYRSNLNAGTKIMAMVKAFSYGSGSFEIANTLQFHKVDYLAVAYADEGIELRNAGINLPILVMNPERGSFPVIIAGKLEPEIYSIGLLQELIKEYRKSSETSPINIHLKFDTGMHRLGFNMDEIDEICRILSSVNFLKVVSVFSHFSSSENKAHDDFSRKQITEFEKICSELSIRLNYKFLRHISNSTGIIRFPEAQFDMVRLGIGLYGIDGSKQFQDKLENVSTFKTTISQIRQLKKGETVGYSRLGLLNHDATIAIIGVGYADGFSRAMGNGNGKVSLNGKLVNTVGNICMDMSMIDITGIPAQEGDEVIIFGNENPVTEIAVSLNTIPYEVLTSISQRVKRIYFKE